MDYVEKRLQLDALQQVGGTAAYALALPASVGRALHSQASDKRKRHRLEDHIAELEIELGIDPGVTAARLSTCSLARHLLVAVTAAVCSAASMQI